MLFQINIKYFAYTLHISLWCILKQWYEAVTDLLISFKINQLCLALSF